MTPEQLIDELAANKEIKWHFLDTTFSNGVMSKYIRTVNKYKYKTLYGTMIESNLCPIVGIWFIKTGEAKSNYQTKEVYKQLGLSSKDSSNLQQAADDNLCTLEAVKLREYMIEKLINVGNNKTN